MLYTVVGTMKLNIANMAGYLQNVLVVAVYWELSTPFGIEEAKENNRKCSRHLDMISFFDLQSTFSSRGDAFSSHNKIEKEGEVLQQNSLDCQPHSFN